MAAQTEVLAGQVEQGFDQHPDAEIYRSQPGLGLILGARVLAEFGDDPDRYADAKARKNYSGMSPITKASGTKRVVLPLRPQPPPRRRIVPAGVRGAEQFPRRPRVLRPATSPRRHPLPSPTYPRQPARRHPPRLPTNPHPLRGTPRLAPRTRQTQLRSLTASGRGMSSQGHIQICYPNPAGP
jgi:Transposase IS116/IS110/IS902 family